MRHEQQSPGAKQSPAGLGLINALLALFILTACSTSLPPTQEEGRHLESSAPRFDQGDIPAIVDSPPLISVPQAEQSPEQFSIVAQDVPARELLFAMARDANINVDIHPAITGRVYLNAINQTLPQILERIARQIDMRWRLDEQGNLLIQPDTPYWHTYRVDYVNVERSANTSAEISTS